MAVGRIWRDWIESVFARFREGERWESSPVEPRKVVLAGSEGEKAVNSVMSCWCKSGAIRCLFVYISSLFLSRDDALGAYCIITVVYCTRGELKM